jgi:hypothetical protein
VTNLALTGWGCYNIFASRPQTAAGMYTTYNYTDALWAPNYGPYFLHNSACIEHWRLDSLAQFLGLAGIREANEGLEEKI